MTTECIEYYGLYEFIFKFFLLLAVFIAACRLSLVGGERGSSPALVHGPLTVVASLVEHRL